MGDGNEYPAGYLQIIAESEVKVGQIWERNGALIEVVYVTPAFAVMHSMHISTPGEGWNHTNIYNIPGRYAQPYVETIRYLLENSGDRTGRCHPSLRYKLVKDVPAKPIFNERILPEDFAENQETGTPL